MATRDAFLAFLATIDRKNYYDILRVQQGATTAQVKDAFHHFALSYHPDQYVEDEPEVSAAASEVFKRGVEAYRILGNKELRVRYDRVLGSGKVRLDERKLSSFPPPPEMKTIEMVARSPKAKKYAIVADRLISIGKLEDARLPLVNACQEEPDNAELAERLSMLYEALALEPL